MGRTVPSFRIVLAEEKQEWKPFRAALPNKKERKEFDDMWDIPRLYITARSNSVSLVPIQPIFISILFHHYKELSELMAHVQQMKARVKDKEQDTSASPTNTGTSDGYLVINTKHAESR
jgi:hypothetical protein